MLYIDNYNYLAMNGSFAGGTLAFASTSSKRASAILGEYDIAMGRTENRGLLSGELRTS